MTKPKLKTPLSKLTWLQKKRIEWKAAGLCYRDGKPTPVKLLRNGTKKKMKQCQECLDYQAKYQKPIKKTK